MDNRQEPEMSLVGHLDELRTRIIVCLITVAVCVLGAFFLAKPLLGVLTMPVGNLRLEPGREAELVFKVNPDGTLKLNDPQGARLNLAHLSQKRFRVDFPADPGRKLPVTSFFVGERPSQQFYYSSPIDPVMMQIKVAIVAGILLSLPILLWQTWRFIQPGLTRKERRMVKPIMVGAVFLFPLGAAFAFYMIKFVLMIMQMYAVENVSPLLNIFNYLSLLSTMMLVSGVIFELPLVLAIAARIGLVNPKFLQTYRRHAYVVLSIAAMVITPGGDPITMLVCLGPLVLLYELSIALSIPMARMHQKDLDDGPTEVEAEEPAV